MSLLEVYSDAKEAKKVLKQECLMLISLEIVIKLSLKSFYPHPETDCVQIEEIRVHC